jgi:hypothetical protein
MRTYFSGAYRYTADGKERPTSETFTFRMRDHMIGGEGWQLSAAVAQHEGRLLLEATGHWDHPLHPGDWNGVHPHTATLRWFPADGTPASTVSVELKDRQLRVARNGLPHESTTVAEHTLLSLPIVALLGPTLTRLARNPRAPRLSLAPPRFSLHSTTCELFCEGHAIITTSAGPLRGTKYTYDDKTVLVAGDGLASYVADGETEAWLVRAASTPSRA